MTFRPVHQCFHRHVSRRKAPMVMMVTRGGRAWRRVRVVLALFRGMLSMVVAYIQGEMSYCLHLLQFPHNCCLLHFCLLHPHCCHLLLIRLHFIRSEERAAICARRTDSMRVSQVQEYRLHKHMAQPASRVLLLLLLLLRFPACVSTTTAADIVGSARRRQQQARQTTAAGQTRTGDWREETEEFLQAQYDGRSVDKSDGT